MAEKPSGAGVDRQAANNGKSSDREVGNTPAPKTQRKKGKKSRGKGKKKKQENANSEAKETKGPSAEEKALEISKQNGRKKTKLALSSHLIPKEFLKFHEASHDLPVQNGKKYNEHALADATRQLLTAKVLGKLRTEGLSCRDIQGKYRWTGYFVEEDETAVLVPTPHICREVITSRDVGHSTHSFSDCNEQFDVSMSVDVITQCDKATIQSFVESSDLEVHYAIMHNHCVKPSQNCKLTPTTKGLVWTRDVPGHFDNKPDIFQPWLLDGGFNCEDGGSITIYEWGPTYPWSGQGIYILRKSDDFVLPEPTTLVGNLVDLLGSLPNTGAYRLSGIKGLTDLWVLAEYLVFQNDSGTQFRLPIKSAGKISASLFGKPVNSGTVSGLKRKLRSTASELDEMTVDLLLSSILEDKIQLNPHRLSYIDRLRLWYGANVDVKSAISDKTSIFAAHARKQSFSLDFGSIKNFLKSIPIAVKILPLLVFIYKYWRRTPRTLFGRLVKSYRWLSVVKSLSGNTPSRKVSIEPTWRGLFTNAKTLLAMRFSLQGSILNLVYAYLLRKTSRKAASAVVSSMAVAPSQVFSVLSEELLKELGNNFSEYVNPSFVGLGFGLSEYIAKIWVLGPQLGYDVTMVSSLPALLMHTALDVSKVSLWKRFTVHFLFNSVALPIGTYAIKGPKWQPGFWGQVSQEGFKGYVKTGPLKDTEDDFKLVATLDRTVVPVDKLYDIGNRDKPVIFPNMIVMQDFRPKVQADVPINFVTGMVNRCGFERSVEAEPGVWISAFDEVKTFVEGKPIHFKTFEEWNANYDGRRKADNLEALFLILEGDTTNQHNNPFLKKEMNHSEYEDEDEPDTNDPGLKDPRVIIPPSSSKTKVVEGPLVSGVAKMMTSEFNGINDFMTHDGIRVVPFIYSGLDPDNPHIAQATRFSRFVNTFIEASVGNSGRSLYIGVSGDDNWMGLLDDDKSLIICADAKRWDAHYREEPLLAERKLFLNLAKEAGYAYSMVSSTDPRSYATIDEVEVSLEQGVEPSISCSAYMRYGLSFTGKLGPMRTSGSQMTSPGNNAGNIGASIEIGRQIFAHGIDRDEGIDDVVKRTWAKFGMVVVTTTTRDAGETDFCSCRLIPCDGEFYLIPKIGRVLARIGWSVSKEKSDIENRSILSAYTKYSKVPFLGPFIERMNLLIGEGPTVDLPDLRYNAHSGVGNEFPEPADDTWAWFQETYGVTQHDHTKFELMLNSIWALPFSFGSPCTSKFLTTDLEVSLSGSILPLLNNWMNVLQQNTVYDMVRTKEQKAARRERRRLKRQLQRERNEISMEGPQRQFFKYTEATERDKAMVKYQECLLDPEEAEPAPIPLIIGGLSTRSYEVRTRSSTTAYVNPAGDVAFSFNNTYGPQWSTDIDLDPNQPPQYGRKVPMVDTTGTWRPVVLGQPSRTGITPELGQVGATILGYPSVEQYIYTKNPGLTLASGMCRRVATEVRIYPVGALLTLGGTAMIAVSSDTNTTALNGVSFDTAYGKQGISVQTVGLSGWENGKYLVIRKFPQQATEINWIPTSYGVNSGGIVGANVASDIWAAFFAKGCPPGAAFRIEVHDVWSFHNADIPFMHAAVAASGDFSAADLGKYAGPAVHSPEMKDAANGASLAHALADQRGPETGKSILSQIGSTLGNVAKKALPFLADMAASVLSEGAIPPGIVSGGINSVMHLGDGSKPLALPPPEHIPTGVRAYDEEGHELERISEFSAIPKPNYGTPDGSVPASDGDYLHQVVPSFNLHVAPLITLLPGQYVNVFRTYPGSPVEPESPRVYDIRIWQAGVLMPDGAISAGYTDPDLTTYRVVYIGLTPSGPQYVSIPYPPAIEARARLKKATQEVKSTDQTTENKSTKAEESEDKDVCKCDASTPVKVGSKVVQKTTPDGVLIVYCNCSRS